MLIGASNPMPCRPSLGPPIQAELVQALEASRQDYDKMQLRIKDQEAATAEVMQVSEVVGGGWWWVVVGGSERAGW